MSCDTYFSLSNLQGSSMETEVGWSPMCIPNKVKLAIFLVLLIIQVVSQLFYVRYTAIELRHRKSWTWRKKLFCLTTFGGFAEIVLLILFISGVQSPGRYILVPINTICAAINCTFSFDMASRVFSEIVKDFALNRRTHLAIRVFTITNWVLIVLQMIFYGILPIIIYDNKLVLNISISIAVTTGSLGSLGFSIACGIMYRNLADQLVSSPDLPLNDDMQAVRIKLIRLSRSAIVFGLLALLTCFFPIWIIIKKNEGLQGFFYFFFCYATFRVVTGANSLMYAAIKSKGKAGTSSVSSQNEKSVKDSKKTSTDVPKETFASFTVEELNPNN